MVYLKAFIIGVVVAHFTDARASPGCKGTRGALVVAGYARIEVGRGTDVQRVVCAAEDVHEGHEYDDGMAREFRRV